VIRRGLFAAPATASRIGRGPVPVDRLRDHPFIMPIYWSNGAFLPAGDDCPLPWSERRRGHEVQTIGLALELAAVTDHLVFGPVLAARPYLKHHALVEIAVAGWDVRDPLSVACNRDRILASTQRTVVCAMKAELAA